MAKSKWQGVARVRRVMRQLPSEMREEIKAALDRGGRSIAAVMRLRTPRASGALQAAITYRVYASMRLRVGIIAGKRIRRKLFYGRIQDLGRKSQTVTVRRRAPNASKVSVYRMRVKQMSGKRFVTGRMPDLRNALTRDLKDSWARVLRRIGSGSNG